MEKCFIIAGGPSLEGFDFSALDSYFTIAINRCFMYFNPSCMYMMDIKFFRWVSSPKYDPVMNRKWIEFPGKKYLLGPARKRKFDLKGATIVPRLESKTLSFDLGKGIYPGNNSGFGALMLAIALGFKEIYLLGYDMKCSENKIHWHEGYSGQKVDRLDTRLKNKFILPFIDFRSIIKDNNIKVYNCNLDSGLEVFPKLSIEEALYDKVPKK